MSIQEPILLLDEQKCRQNIKAMAEKARKHQIRLRPHCKTHQSHIVGQWMREEGIRAITVSSLKMAHYFAKDGWTDITVAFPINVLEIDRINQLADRIRLNLIIVDPEVIPFLEKNLKGRINLYVKIDVGYRRTGVHPQDKKALDHILNTIKFHPKLNFKGFLAHAGHSYRSRSKEEILEIHRENMTILSGLKSDYYEAFPGMEVSIGDTPSCSVVDDFEGVDEIRPGNFVFYDLAQNQIGSCQKSQIAIALACPVVAKHADRSEVILYGGGVHFSKDFLALENNKKSYGELVERTPEGWSDPIPQCYLTKLSQEHGTLKVTKERFDQTSIGDMVSILPVHACMAANAMKSYRTLDGLWVDHMNGIIEQIKTAY